MSNYVSTHGPALGSSKSSRMSEQENHDLMCNPFDGEPELTLCIRQPPLSLYTRSRSIITRWVGSRPSSQTPLQADLLAPLDASEVKRGAAVLAKTRVDWNSSACHLRAGSIVIGHIIELEQPSKQKDRASPSPSITPNAMEASRPFPSQCMPSLPILSSMRAFRW
jgi:hypothetical protein